MHVLVLERAHVWNTVAKATGDSKVKAQLSVRDLANILFTAVALCAWLVAGLEAIGGGGL